MANLWEGLSGYAYTVPLKNCCFILFSCSTGQVLDINLSWRLHKVSDGQRRRVQICMGLLKPLKV
jgi:hypothetical protein